MGVEICPNLKCGGWSSLLNKTKIRNWKKKIKSVFELKFHYQIVLNPTQSRSKSSRYWRIVSISTTWSPTDDTNDDSIIKTIITNQGTTFISIAKVSTKICRTYHSRSDWINKVCGAITWGKGKISEFWTTVSICDSGDSGIL